MINEKEMDFVVYCVENLANYINEDSVKTFDILDESNLIEGYIVKFYDILHTQSKAWIVEDLVEQLEKNAIELYMEDLISEDEALKRLSFPIENRQICFRNQDIIDKYLIYKGCDEYVGR